MALDNGLDDAFWDEVGGLHRPLTANQWEVLSRSATGASAGQIAHDLHLSERAVRRTLARAGERIFSLTPYGASDASLGAWTHAHITCCRPDSRGAA